MKLEGSIDAFGLPDILQLLSATQKSGALRIHQEVVPSTDAAGAQLSGVIRLADGAICGASSDLSRQSLARRVVGAALVGDDVLSAAVEQVKFAGTGGVVRALITAGALSEEDVLPVARLQTTDAVCDLLRWTSGNFSFRDAEADPDSLSLRLSVEEIVAEGQRRLATWPALTALVPSAATILSLSIAPSTDPVCSREEWALLALVDGRRTVAEIVALLGAGEYAIVRALAALVERGLLVNSEGGNFGISGLADLERRQGLLAVLETASPIPQPRVTGDEITATLPTEPAAPVSVQVPEPEVPSLATSEPIGLASSAITVEPLAAESSSFKVAAAPVAEVTAAADFITEAVLPVADVAPAQPRSGEFVGTTFQLGASTAAETTAPVETVTPVAAETADAVSSALDAPAITPMTMGNVAMAPEAVPAMPPVPAPASSDDDDPAVTRSTLLRLIAGVQGL